jgi:hypothetical protein
MFMESFWRGFAALNPDESDALIVAAGCFAVKKTFQNCNV